MVLSLTCPVLYFLELLTHLLKIQSLTEIKIILYNENNFILIEQRVSNSQTIQETKKDF